MSRKSMHACLFALWGIALSACNSDVGYSIVNNNVATIRQDFYVNFRKLYSIDVTDISLFNKRNYFKPLIAFDEMENIYIADSYQGKIYKYDNKGRFVKSFGRQGQGPEEFYLISSLLIDEDVLRVFDGGGDIKNITLDGRFISRSRVSIPNRMGVRKLADKYFVMAGETDFKKLKVKISTTDKNMLNFHNIIDYDHKPGIRGTYEYYMFDWLLITKKGELYYPESNLEKYTIVKYDDKGAVLGKINRKYHMDGYSEDAKNRFFKVYKYEIDEGMIEFPPNPPAVNLIFQDLKENIWVLVGETYEDNRNGEFENLVDIFDSGGKIVHSFKTKILSKNCLYNNGKIYRVRSMDETAAEQYIDVYGIEYAPNFAPDGAASSKRGDGNVDF
ncbi:MAG: 6-bladed beta-propeller [Candidatus Aminicenantes bacterium]|nr:6-bladed beta-propeller [Candidatus Aminicenantes bacterium]